MAVKIQDVLKADIVFAGVGLLRNQQGLDAFTESVGTEIGADASNSQLGVPVPGLRIALNRDRIVLDLAPERTVIARDYPSSHDLDRLAEVTALATENTGSEGGVLWAVGFNITLVYDQDSGMTASTYIADRLLSEHAFKSGGWQLTAGANRTVIDANGPRITQSVAPRFNDASTTKIFASLNLHTETNQMPHHSEIFASLQYAWKLIHDFPVQFDEDSTNV